jgi:MoaA/NifB/PqqE/SkfB family radical SAM enzyme
MYGRVWMCCPSWLPYSIGNILEDDMKTIWNSEKAQQLRQQVFNGKWNYCNHIQCPHIQDGSLPTLESIESGKYPSAIPEFKAVSNRSTIVEELPTKINFSNDESCNLKCPSCRIGKILFTSGKEYDKRKHINDRLIADFLTTPTDRKFSIHVTGSGDPFASKIYRDMLTSLKGSDFPNLVVNMQCNGIMFTPKMWDKIKNIHDNLGYIRISYDAAQKHTYENVTRLGGKWDLLLENCDFLNARQIEYPNMKLSYDFVVQNDNFREMPAFVDLIRSRYNNATSLSFNLVTDWGTWDAAAYEEKCIWKTTHPNHDEFTQILKDPIFAYHKVSLGNVLPYREKALNGK